MRNIWQTSAAASQGIPGFRGRINIWILDGTTTLNTASWTLYEACVLRMVPAFSRAQPLSEAGESRLRKLDRARRSAVNSSASWTLIVDWPKRSTRVQPRIAETMG